MTLAEERELEIIKEASPTVHQRGCSHNSASHVLED